MGSYFHFTCVVIYHRRICVPEKYSPRQNVFFSGLLNILRKHCKHFTHLWLVDIPGWHMKKQSPSFGETLPWRAASLERGHFACTDKNSQFLISRVIVSTLPLAGLWWWSLVVALFVSVFVCCCALVCSAVPNSSPWIWPQNSTCSDSIKRGETQSDVRVRIRCDIPLIANQPISMLQCSLHTYLCKKF